MLRTLLLGCMLLWLPFSFAAAEEITEFTSDIRVTPEGSLRITETILYDFGEAKRHGIFRTWPRQHPQSSGTWYTDRVVDVDVVEVQRGSSTAPYTRSDSTRDTELRIGDPDVTISGRHTYTITYEVAGALTYYDDGAIDLYWNVTGDEWSVPIEQAIARVSGAGVATDTVGSCYVGQAGSRDSCAQATSTGTAVIFTADRLMAGEGLTIAQALDADVVAQQVREEWNLWWLWLTFGLLWLVGVGLYSYRYYHQHNPRRSIVTQFAPYADFKPMFTGVLIDGTLHSRDISAGILYLAEQGFLRIRASEQTKLWLFSSTDYELELLRNPEETETSFQRELLRLLFGAKQQPGNTVSLHTLKHSTDKQKRNQEIIKRLKEGIETDLVTRGFYERSYQPALLSGAKAVAGLSLATIVVLVLGLAGAELLVGATVLAIATLVILALVSTRRTEKGYAARSHLQGFKRFLSMTGTERFAFHDAPKKSPEQFTEYLPYAVAFAVEKEWAEVFADITIPQPSWYEDSRGSQQFVAATLVSDLDAFSQSFSQSSGSAASSGGGAAGGGAGGGGGGSW